MIMGVSLRLILSPHAALAAFLLASPVLAQHGLFGSRAGRQAGTPAKIVNPRTSSASPPVSPLNVSGTWTMTDCCYSYNVILNQDQAGNLTGSITIHAPADPCVIPKWPISGAVTGSNTFSFTATNPDGGDEDCFAAWQSNATMTSNSAASVTWDVWNDQGTDTNGTMTRTPLTIVLVDPVASGLLDGNAVTQNVDTIAGDATPIYVRGAAADGAAQVIVEVKGVQAGDSVQLNLVNENAQQDSTANDGGLFPLGSDPSSASSTLTLQAQNTNPPMAIAVWVGPKDFSRGAQDATTLQRSLTIQTKSTNTNPDGSTASDTGSGDIVTVRPPVVLIHGLWSSGSGTWGGFHPNDGNNWSLWDQMHSQQVDYSQVIPITNPSPSYSITSVTAAALGFSFNAPNVLLQLQTFIANYALHNNVAAVQADVVAHSMGGDISRTMPGLPTFAGQNNYGLGPVHKLITIGTPHTGTPVAVDLLPGTGGDPNACVRKLLNRFGRVSLLTASVNGIPVSGAVGDLRGTSFPHGPFSIAYIAGTTLPSNLAQLNATIFSDSGFIYSTCGNIEKDPLALRLTPAGWNQEFAGLPNDGIVPLASQTNGMPTNLVNPGVIHSPGFEELNFAAPSEVDPESGIPDEVVNLLNEAVSGPDFFPSN